MSESGHAGPGSMPVDPDVEPQDLLRGRERTRHHTRLAWGAVVERRDILAVIAAGGAVGSLARWGTSVWLTHPAGGFPWSTFAVNVLGSFLLGVLMVFVTQVWTRSRYLRPFLGVGVLGGFTTFSTYMLDVHELLLEHRPLLAGAYVVSSLLVGMAAVWLGLAVARPLAARLLRRHAGVLA